jgi:hypothetical protein
MRKRTQNPGGSLKSTTTKNTIVSPDRPIWDPMALQKSIEIELWDRAERAKNAVEEQQQVHFDNETEDDMYEPIDAAYEIRKKCFLLEAFQGIDRRTILEVLRRVTAQYE